MTGRLTAGALVLLAVAGCTSAPSPPRAAAPATAGSPAPDCPAAGLPSLLVIGGPGLFDAELQRYDLCTATGTRVGELRRYSAISAAGGHVAVANAAAGPLLLVRSAGRPNGSGELALLRVEDQRLQPLPPFAGGVVGGAAWP